MGDKGEGAVINLKKWVDIIYGQPLYIGFPQNKLDRYLQKKHNLKNRLEMSWFQNEHQMHAKRRCLEDATEGEQKC